MGVAGVYGRPAKGSATGRVWEIADDLVRRRGSMPRGRDVADAYVREGGNERTAFTHYSHWKKAYLARHAAALAAPDEVRTAQWRVESGGRLVIPADFLAAMQVGEDGRVAARLEDGELRLVSASVALAQAQDLVRSFDRGEGSPVDELIRERRAEAERE